jgi:hypothetical protein
LEYFLSESDEMWSWPEGRLLDLGLSECEQLGFVERSEVVDGTVVRMPNAYPVYDHGYAKRIETIREYLSGFSNLQTVGRNGLHRYNNQDHSMLTGLYAARNITGEAHNVWSVNVDRAYHEGGAIRPAPAEPSGRARRPVSELDDLLRTAFARWDPTALGTAVGIVCGVGLFLATAVLLLRGGDAVGPRLALLGHFLIGYRVSWGGALLGMVEAGCIGFAVAYVLARGRNVLIRWYLRGLRRAETARRQRELLDLWP